MKNRFLVCFFALGLGLNFAICQKTATDFSAPKLPSLDSLIRRAIRNAPRLRMQDAYIAALESERKIQRLDWSDHFFMNGGAQVGTANISALNATQSADIQVTTFRNDLNYNLGFGMRMPLSEVLKRPEEHRLRQLMVDRAVAERDVFEQDLRAAVTREYDEIQLANENVATRAASLEANRMAHDVSEQYFRAGQLPAAEYSQILARKVDAEEAFNKAKSQLSMHLHQLQILVGD